MMPPLTASQLMLGQETHGTQQLVLADRALAGMAEKGRRVFQSISKRRPIKPAAG